MPEEEFDHNAEPYKSPDSQPLEQPKNFEQLVEYYSIANTKALLESYNAFQRHHPSAKKYPTFETFVCEWFTQGQHAVLKEVQDTRWRIIKAIRLFEPKEQKRFIDFQELNWDELFNSFVASHNVDAETRTPVPHFLKSKNTAFLLLNDVNRKWEECTLENPIDYNESVIFYRTGGLPYSISGKLGHIETQGDHFILEYRYKVPHRTIARVKELPET